jgi:hypothetical protein
MRNVLIERDVGGLRQLCRAFFDGDRGWEFPSSVTRVVSMGRKLSDECGLSDENKEVNILVFHCAGSSRHTARLIS